MAKNKVEVDVFVCKRECVTQSVFSQEHCMSHIVAQSQQVGWNDPRTCLVREKSGSRTVYTLKVQFRLNSVKIY